MDPRRSALAIVLGSLALLLAPLSAGPGQASPPASAAAARATISLGDNFFSPASKAVRAGTTVRFKWIGFNRHNVVKGSGPGRPFGSPTTARRGVNFTRSFAKPGTYRLLCTIHPAQMRLKLVVGR